MSHQPVAQLGGDAQPKARHTCRRPRTQGLDRGAVLIDEVRCSRRAGTARAAPGVQRRIPRPTITGHATSVDHPPQCGATLHGGNG